MVSMRNLSPADLIEIANQIIDKGFNKKTSAAAVLVTTSQYIKEEGERTVNQAIILCTEVDV